VRTASVAVVVRGRCRGSSRVPGRGPRPVHVGLLAALRALHLDPPPSPRSTAPDPPHRAAGNLGRCRDTAAVRAVGVQLPRRCWSARRQSGCGCTRGPRVGIGPIAACRSAGCCRGTIAVRARPRLTGWPGASNTGRLPPAGQGGAAAPSFGTEWVLAQPALPTVGGATAGLGRMILSSPGEPPGGPAGMRVAATPRDGRRPARWVLWSQPS
jgi:hypothetical protein